MIKKHFIPKVFRGFLIVCLFVSSLQVYAVNTVAIDSLLSLLLEDIPDSRRSEALNELAWEYRRLDPDRALLYAQEAMELALNTGSKKEEASSYARKGLIYKAKGDFVKANEAYFKCIRIRDALGDQLGVSNMYNNLGVVSELQEDFGQALDYYVRAEEIITALGLPDELAEIYENKGVVYDLIGKEDSALILFRKAQASWVEAGDLIGMARSYTHLGVLYHKDEKWNQAIAEFEKAMEIYKEQADREGFVLSMLNIGGTRLALGDHSSAVHTLKMAESLADSLGATNILVSIYDNLSSAFVSLNEYQTAFLYYTLRTNLKDSLFNENKSRQIAQIRTLYEVEQNEKKNLALSAKIRQKTFERNALIGGSAASLLLSLLVVLNFHQRMRANKLRTRAEQTVSQQKILDILKVQEISSINAMIDGQEQERQRIAQELHDRLGSMLATVKLHFETIEERIQDVEEVNRLQYDRAQILLDEACMEVRKIAHNLQSGVLQRFGLVPAMSELAETISASQQLEVVFTAHGVERLETAIERHLYRILQEMIANTIRHAKAKNIEIQLVRRNGILNLTFEDDGNGFYPDQEKKSGGMGIATIRHTVEHKLNGEFSLDSRIGSGTFMTVEIPVISVNSE